MGASAGAVTEAEESRLEVDPEEIKHALLDRREIAILDVRSEAEYASGHPLFAASLPLGRIEHEAYARLPYRSVSIVVYDAGGGEAPFAVNRLASIGYPNVSMLRGGLNGWRASGGEVFSDVNVPSKAFGELVVETRSTPLLPAQQLATMIDSGADVVVVDARRFDEFQTMSIPSATSVPGGELVYRASAFASSPSTTIVVNCAGRTRSIVGAQSLLNAGVPNKVMALENGTIGWKLAGLELEHNRDALLVDSSARPETVSSTRLLADRTGVQRLKLSELHESRFHSKTLYRFDVRTAQEFEAGHLAGFRWVEGGQLIQETDSFAPVRGAAIVLSDHDGVRANMAASWLAQMNWSVYVLDDTEEAGLVTGRSDDELAAVPLITEARHRELARRSVRDRYRRPYVGTDVSPEAMQSYLTWEFGLVEQLARDGTHGFFVI
jgi:rhodanese-related sulfurtransferase